MDKLKELYQSYVDNGLLSKKTSFEEFSSANSLQLKSLYDLGVSNGVLSQKTDIDTFSSAWSPQKKKELSEVSSSQFLGEPSASDTSAEVPAAFGEIPKFERGDQGAVTEVDTPNWYNVAKSALGQTYEIGKSALLKAASYTSPLSTPLTREVIDIQAKAAVEKIREEGPKFEQSFTESIAQGKFGDAALQAEEFLLGTAPLAATAAAISIGTGGAGTPAALALMGGYGAQSAHIDAKGEKFYEEMSPLMRAGYTGAMGGLEVLGEGIGGKILSGAVKKLAAQQITRQAFEQTAKEIAKGALKSNGVAVTEEALAEFTTGFGQSAVDQYARTGKVNFADAFRQGLEGAAMGAVGGAVFNAPSTIADASALANSMGRDLKNAKARTQINNFKDKLDAASTPQEQDYYAQKLAEAIKVRTRNATEDTKFYEYVGTQSPQDLEQFLAIDNELKRYAATAKVVKDADAIKDIKAKVGDLIQQQKDLESKYLAYDSQEEVGVPSPVVEGEAVVETQPIEGTSQEAPEAGGVLQVPSQGKVDVITIAERQSEAESKIKRTDLFTGVGDFSTQLGGSDKAAVPVSHSENNGIEIVEYAHPETGSVDVIVTGKSENDFVGFYRLYENGKPTNKWSSKFENQSRNKEDFKTMISGVQALLPKGHEYTEKTSISTDGLRVWNQQLSRGYELQYDENGNVITNRVYINGDAIVNELGVNVEKGKFQPVRATEQEFEKAKEVLVPYLEKLGLSSKNIYFESPKVPMPPGFVARGLIAIDLPILKSQPVEKGPEVASQIEATVFAAPFYDTKVNNIGEARTIRQSKPYVKNLDSIRQSSSLFNVEVDEVEEDVVEVAQVVPRAKNKNNLTEAVADNAIAQAERLAKRLGLNVKIITHNSRKAFDEAMNQLSKNGASDAAREGGRILFDRNEIHINLEDMTLSDPFHEVFHAAFVNRFAKGSQAQRTKAAVEFKNGVLKVLRSGSAQDKQLADEVEQFVNDGDYNPSEKAEEFMAQTAGIIATNAQRISKSTMDKLIQWLNNFIGKIAPSLKVTTRGDFIDFMNSFSGALFADTDSSVQATESTVNLTSTNDLLDSSSRGDFTISYFEDTDQYKKFVEDGLVVNNFSLNQIAGQPVATHQPDNFMVGDVKLGDKVVVEGDGGVYFVLKFGEVWASGKQSSASGIAKAINWSRENSTDGKGRMLLARGTTPKLISSTKGVKGGMQILEEMVDRNLIPRKDFRASLIRVGKKYGIDFSGNDSMISIKNDIEQKFMKPSDSTFAKRGSFFEDLISDISSTSTTSKENIDGIRKFLGSTKRISFSKEGITSAIAELMTERMLIDLPSSHAYAVIEVDNDVKVEKSKKHDSYPYSIVQVDGKRPTLYLLKDRPKAVPSLLTKDGERATNAKVGFAQMGYGRAIVDPALLAASATQESQVNKAYDELLESSSKKQVQLGMQQAEINYEIDTQIAESSSWQQRERTPMEKYIDLARIKLQDKLYGVIKLQEDIEYSTGKPVGLDQDFRNADVLMHGKAANDLAESMERAEKVAENVKKSGTTLEAFDDLLYALHAQERNRMQRIKNTDIPTSIKDLRDKNNLKPMQVAEMSGIDIETYRDLESGTAEKGITSEELNKILSVYGMSPSQFYTQYTKNNAGSGMTDVEAQTILTTYGLDPINPDVKNLKPELRDAVSGVYAIIADSRERMLDYGLETLDTVVAFESMYKNYVPLQGFEGEDSASEIIDGGRSIEVRGRQKRALGRRSKADSPFLTAVAQNQSTIIRARKNEVAQKLYKLAEANPNDQIWKVIDPAVNKEYKKDPTVNGIKYVAKTISDYLTKPENFSVRIDGEYKFIQFADPRMAEMLRGANVAKADFITKYLGQFNRMLSSFITTYDPEFVLRNFSRDIQVAVINAISEQEIEGGLLKGKNITNKIVKSVPKSIKAIFNMSKKGASPSNEFEQYYKEFVEDGAKTEWFYSKSVDELRNDVDKLVSDKKDTRFGSTKVKAAEDFTKNFVERINSSVENGVRLAAYMEARKAGLSREKAAELAKNLTVNFNKSGEWGTVANSLYLFFNASVQGTSRLVRTLKPQFQKNDDGTRSLQVTTAQKIAVSMFIAGSLMSLLNEALSDDDEDGKSFYSKIPDFEKERNIIIMLPKSFKWDTAENYIKIPLPYGLNVFYVAGNAMADAGQGLKSVGETATNILQAAIGSFSPINFPSSEDFSSWITKFITPTIGQIPLSLALNEDYFGRTIYNENFPTDPTPKPESELGRKGATPQSTWIAKELNKLTGGSEFRSGIVDINPDKIDFVLETLSGGAGRFALRSTSAIGNLITGNWDQIESNDIPFARVFYGQPRKFVDLQSYFDKRIEVNQLMEEVRSGDVTGKEGDRIKGAYRVNKSVDKALRNIRKAEKKAEDIEDPDKRDERLKEIEIKRYEQIARLQKAYEQYKIDEL